MPTRIRRRITSARREQIESEQNQLSQTIVRPFEVVSGLPVSYNAPPNGHYEDVLKTPLTIKDTGVLYRSLMKSRYTYVFLCPMFQLYWVKQSSYAKKLAEENKPVPKSLKDDILSEREPVLGLDVSARDVMVKLCDCSFTFGPHSFETRLFIAKDERSEKKDKKDKDKDKEGDPKEKPTTEPAKENPTKENPTKETPVPSQAPAPSTSSASLPANVPKPAPTAPTVPSSSPPSTTPPAPTSTPAAPTTTTAPSAPTSSLPQPPAFLKTPLGFTKTQPPPPKLSPPAPTTTTLTAPKPKPDLTNMQSIENTIMISNLNTIARQDESLNKLMKIVALGSASPTQIMTFQGYIKRAREMGPQPHHAYLFQGSNSSGYVRREYKKKKEKKADIPKDQKLTAFQEKYLNNATILFEYVENANVRFKIPKDAICEVLPSQIQSTAESDDVKDILVSFLWIHNQKEVDDYEAALKIYKDKIKEREEEEKRKEEEARKEEERIKEEEKKREEAEKERLEKEEKGETEEAKPEEEPEVKQEPVVEARPKRVAPRRAASRKKKKGGPVRKAAPKKLEPPVEPEYRFTALSFTIHGIPSKFVPIITNSFNPVEKVQEKMTKILREGTRISSFYLWYQVDGKLDEAVAEEIRSQLVQEEKKMTGIPASSIEKATTAKRKLKEKEPKVKKQKKDEDVKSEPDQQQPIAS